MAKSFKIEKTLDGLLPVIAKRLDDKYVSSTQIQIDHLANDTLAYTFNIVFDGFERQVQQLFFTENGLFNALERGESLLTRIDRNYSEVLAQAEQEFNAAELDDELNPEAEQ